MASDHDLILTRVLDAPREKVWAAWTDQAQIQKWWGPAGVTNQVNEWSLQPGGKIHIIMLAGPKLGPMAGQEWPMRGEMKEIDPPEKLIFSSGPVNAEGNFILQTLTTVTLEDQGGKTKLTVRVEVTQTTPESEMPLAGMEQGWNQQLDKLMNFVKE